MGFNRARRGPHMSARFTAPGAGLYGGIAAHTSVNVIAANIWRVANLERGRYRPKGRGPNHSAGTVQTGHRCRTMSPSSRRLRGGSGRASTFGGEMASTGVRDRG